MKVSDYNDDKHTQTVVVGILTVGSAAVLLLLWPLVAGAVGFFAISYGVGWLVLKIPAVRRYLEQR